MIINSSYACEIKHLNNIFKPTIKLFNKAISFCINCFYKEWDYLKELDSFTRKQEAEHLIHSTKGNVPKYVKFDKLFYKMPSYMRRAVINFSLGYLSSYYSNLELWEANGKIGRKPTLQKNHNQFPVFYKDNMYSPNPIKDDTVLLKLYVNNDWVWVKVNLKHTDLQYIRKHLNKAKMSVPTLEHKNKKWFLRFCFTENIQLNKTKLKEQKVLAVDLGLNNDAVCSIMKKDGTILKRKFINFKSDKDQLFHTLNKIKKISKQQGSHNTTKLWRIAKFRNEELSRKIAKAISDFAIQESIDVIVFEHLDFKGKVKVIKSNYYSYGENKVYKKE